MNINEIINEIIELKNYSYFYKATTKSFNETIEYFGEMPEDLQEFYRNFNGGLFFGQYFASVKEQEYGYTFEELNDGEFKQMNYNPENVLVFCDTGYGDYVGYDTLNKNIIQINPEDDEENWIIWDSFTKYLQEFLEESKKLIEDGVLEPLR